MAAINFPSGASTGTIFTATNSVVYIFDGVKWTGEGIVPGPADLTGDGGNASSSIRILASLDGGNA
jgi:hypothetical protein